MYMYVTRVFPRMVRVVVKIRLKGNQNYIKMQCFSAYFFATYVSGGTCN